MVPRRGGYHFNNLPLGRFHCFLNTLFLPDIPWGAAPWTMVKVPVRLDLTWWAPLFAWFVLFASYPLLALNWGRVRRCCQRLRGRCVKCGYDLTGNISGVFPECGT